MRILSRIAACLLLAAAGGTALAAPPDDGPPGPPHGGFHVAGMPPPGMGGPMTMGEGPGPMLPLMLHGANLSEEQHEKVRKILDIDREELQKLFADLEKANDDLSRKLFAAGQLQIADVSPEVSRVSDLRRQLMEHGVKTTLAIRAVLTPEQLAKLTERKRRIDELRSELDRLMGEGGDRVFFFHRRVESRGPG